jgi:WD40 repeat protein
VIRKGSVYLCFVALCLNCAAKRSQDVGPSHKSTIQASIPAPIGNLSEIQACAWSSKGDHFAILDQASKIHIGEPNSGKIIKTFGEGNHLLVYSPNGQFLATRSADRIGIRIWDISGQEKSLLKGHKDPIYSISYSPDGDLLASGSGNWTDYTMRIWAPLLGKELKTIEMHGIASQVEYAKEGNVLAGISWDRIMIFHPPRYKPAKILQIGDKYSPADSFALSPDGKAIYVLFRAVVSAWSTESAKLLYSLEGSEGIAPSVFQMSTDGTRLLIVDQNDIMIWDLRSRTQIRNEEYLRKTEFAEHPIACVSPDWHYLITQKKFDDSSNRDGVKTVLIDIGFITGSK